MIAERAHVWSWAFVASLSGCATVYDEPPPAVATGGAVAAGGSPSSSGGGGGVAVAAPVGSPAPLPGPRGGASGSTATLPGTPSGAGGSAAAMSSGMEGGAGNGAAPSGGGSAAAGTGNVPQFPSGTLLLNEDFEGDVSTWVSSSESQWATVTETGSLVYEQSESTSSEPRLAVAGDVTWRDVIVEADVQIVAFNGSSSSYLVGLCVRVTSPESFYMVGIRSNDGRVGVRLFGDNNTNLEQSTAQDLAAAGTWHHLRVEAIGSTLSVVLDGEAVLTLSDATHPAGGIGLCTVRASARFDNVVVTAP